MKNCSIMLQALLVIVMVTGCAPVSLTGSWKDPAAPSQQYRKLLVVGVAEKNQTRQVFEEVFAGELRKRGVAAIPSYTVTGPERPTRESLEEAVKKSGADGVITTRLVKLKRETVENAGFIMTDRGYTNSSFHDPGFFYPNDLYGYYGATVSYASFKSQPVEVTTSTVATLETNLFSRETGRLVWSGTTSAVKPEGIITVSTELAQVVIEAMARAGLL